MLFNAKGSGSAPGWGVMILQAVWRSQKKNPVVKYISHGDIMYSMVIIVNNQYYLKVAKRVNFKNSHHKKKTLLTTHGH